MNTYLDEVLAHLIAFDTVSAHSDVPAMEYLAGHLEQHGFRTYLYRGDFGGVQQANLVAWTGPPRSDGLIISGHLDTVPVEGQPGWEHEPLRMERDGDRIFGRGTSDMKGFLAQCVDAARALDHKRLKRPLVFLFTSNEEVGSLGAQRVAPELRSILGDTPCPPLCWIGEPTSYHVLHTHKSIGVFEIRVRGRGGHSGAPEQGVNAIAVMGKVIEAIGRYQAERHAIRSAEFEDVFDSPYDVLNFGTIAGGIAINVIAEECALRLTYRTLPNSDPRVVYDEIRTRIDAIDAHDYGSPNHLATIEVGEPFIVPAMLSPRGTMLELALFKATGTHSSRGALFSTDGAWLAQAGITPLICGPGDYDQAHRPNESIGRGAFERGPEVILQVVGNLCCDD
ncbi:MAG: M20 family metallopeptidase [Candidatus Binataceae bacterium]